MYYEGRRKSQRIKNKPKSTETNILVHILQGPSCVSEAGLNQREENGDEIFWKEESGNKLMKEKRGERKVKTLSARSLIFPKCGWSVQVREQEGRTEGKADVYG